jgi:pimeloyl-ACP methyl ester carboxylesterase
VRNDDISFIISQLEDPKIMKPLLADFPGKINYKQLAIWGHSFGGATAAAVLHSDKRVVGGLDLDGMLVDPILSTDITKPFILAGRKGHDAEDPSWNQFWPHLKGKRAEIAIANTQHGAFKDDLLLLNTLNLNISAEIKQGLQEALGSIDPHQLDKDLNGILTAYFDLLFDGKKQPLQAIPHNFANVTIVRSNKL